MKNALIVSLHDVSPLTFDVCRTIIDDLAENGILQTSLLVIPDHHHRGHFLQDEKLCTWLTQMQQTGHELVIHGYFHQRPQRPAETWREKLVTRFYTAGEGEFFDLDRASAAEKFRRAQAEFAERGWQPTGFIAPAWLLSAESEMAAKSAGFSYTTRLGEIRDLRSGRSHASQSLVWSVRSGWRRVVSLGWNRFLLGRLKDNPVIRVGIHPPDWSYSVIRRQILQLLEELKERRTAMTYAAWIAEQD